MASTGATLSQLAFRRGLAEFYAAQGCEEWPAGTERLQELVNGILATKERADG